MVTVGSREESIYLPPVPAFDLLLTDYMLPDAAGTDIAIEAGDIVLMSDDLGKIAYVRELSHRTVSTIRQNIAVSMINVAFMVIAALFGYLGLVTGLLLNEGSAVFVILNALRLLKWRSKAEPERTAIEPLSVAIPRETLAAPAAAGLPARPAARCRAAFAYRQYRRGRATPDSGRW